MKFQINITKEVLELSKMCSTATDNIGQNCAIGKAIVDIFGLKSWVGLYEVSFYKDNIDFKNDVGSIGTAFLPKVATEFIKEFDKSTPNDRINMTPFSFEIDVDDKIIEEIVDISEITTLLKSAPYMELVN